MHAGIVTSKASLPEMVLMFYNPHSRGVLFISNTNLPYLNLNPSLLRYQ